MTRLLETLAAELERPRTITAQVINHLVGTHGITRDEIGNFLAGELGKLENYEVDLILSPLFTPTLADQATVAELLGREAVPKSDWPALIEQLVARPTQALLLTEDGIAHRPALRAVTIERFVHRLRLDGAITQTVINLINQRAAADRPLLKAIARRAIWTDAKRGEILVKYLSAVVANDSCNFSDARELLKLAETYQPADVAELLRSIPHWLEVLRQEINEAGGPKPFFNERVQDLHGGGRDQRRQDNSRLTAKEAERAALERLQRLLSA